MLNVGVTKCIKMNDSETGKYLLHKNVLFLSLLPDVPGTARARAREGRGSPGAAADTVTIISFNTHIGENEERQWPLYPHM